MNKYILNDKLTLNVKCTTYMHNFIIYFRVNIYLHNVILVIFGLPSVKKKCLDSNFVIWRFIGFGLSWHQISKFKVLSPPIWANFGLPLYHIIDFVQLKFMKVQNQRIFKLQSWNLNKLFYKKVNQKPLNIY